MKTAAVICEFNPFHTGHAYLLRHIREDLGFGAVVCFMSGNFVQRGEPAVMDKYLRASDALQSGADLVLELPMPFSASASGWFAHAAVSMILKSGICTHLVFGVEPGVSVEDLERSCETQVDAESFQAALRSGKRYADALFPEGSTGIRGSNALLAISYLQALKDLDTEKRLIPVAVERRGDAYGMLQPKDQVYTSASAIRTFLWSDPEKAIPYLPYFHANAAYCSRDSLSMLTNEKLLQSEDYTQFWDVSLPLSEHLRKTKYQPLSFTERIEDCLHSCYSRSRISRALLHLTLGIRGEEVLRKKEEGYALCCRVLSYRSASGLLSEMKRKGSLHTETRNARFYEAVPELLYYDQVWHILTGTPPDFYQSPVIL